MNPFVNINHVNLKETNKHLNRIANAMELLLFHAYDITPEVLKTEASTDTEGTSVTYANPDEQAIAEELEKSGYTLPEEPEDPEKPLKPLDDA